MNAIWRENQFKPIKWLHHLVDMFDDSKPNVPEVNTLFPKEVIRAALIVTYSTGIVETFNQVPRFKVLSDKQFYVCDDDGDWKFKGHVRYLSMIA